MNVTKLSWLSVGGSSEQGANGSVFMKLQEGQNKIRIVGDLYKFFQHYQPAVRCPGSAICPVCKQGTMPKTRYAMVVIDRADKKLKVLEVGTKVVNQIREIVSMYGKDPGKKDGMDFIIKKQTPPGDKKLTNYIVMSDGKTTPFSDEEKSMILDLMQNKKQYQLTDIKKPHTKEEILEKMQSGNVPSGSSQQTSVQENTAVAKMAQETSANTGGDEFGDKSEDDSSTTDIPW